MKTIYLTAAASAKLPKLSALAYSGDLMRIFGSWYIIDLAHLEIPASFPILSDHDSRRGGVLGQAGARIDAGRLYVSGELLASNQAVREIIGAAKNGFQWRASVGVEITESRYIAAGEKINVNGRTITSPPAGCYLVSHGVLREVSIVSLAADPRTVVNIAARKDPLMPTFSDWLKTQGIDESKLSADERTRLQARYIADTTPAPGTVAATANIDAAPAPDVQAAVQAEQTRIGEINRECDTIIARGCPDTDLVNQLRGQAISGEISMQDLHRANLVILRASRPQSSAIQGGGGSNVPPETVLTCAFIQAAGHPQVAARHYPAPVVEAAQRIGHGGFYGALSAMARRNGHDAPPHDNWLAASFSTVSLPTIISSGLEKMLLDAFTQAPNSIRTIAKRIPLANFRTSTMARLETKGGLEEVAADGELKHISLEESTATIRLATYGCMIGLTRQAMINDDLGAFNQLPQDFANLASRKIADVGWTLILANASDFFGIGNANLLTGANSALSVTSLASAITLMRQQVDENGSPIDVEPLFLVVPPELEFLARQILVSTQFARNVEEDDNLPMGQGIAPNLQLVVEPRISAAAFSGSSETQWYVLSSPANGAIALGLLNSREQPVIESIEQPPQLLGAGWRAFIDFGVALVEPKVAVRSDGV